MLGQWPRRVERTSPEEIEQYCLGDEDWQAFRRSMKGLPTPEKLSMLLSWQLKNSHRGRRTQVQVDNYINALKRGGQLNMNLEVQR